MRRNVLKLGRSLSDLCENFWFDFIVFVKLIFYFIFSVMNLIWKYMHESLPESAFKESKYYQLIEGTAFGHHDEHASECHDGECKVVAAHH